MKPHLVCACLLAFPSLSFAQPAAEGLVATPGGDYGAGYKAGAAEADKDLEEGVAAFYIYGTRESPEFLDRKTGLPCDVIAGCVVNNTILGRAAGYNDRINEYIVERGLPSNSFKRWEKELFDLQGYFEKRAKTAKPHRLTLGGPAAISPDGESAIWLVRKQSKERDGTMSDYLQFVVTVGAVDRKPFGAHDGASNIEVFWGPNGSGFAVIRAQEEKLTVYTAVDVKRGKSLRIEYGHGKER
jgi:hypothetical protein